MEFNQPTGSIIQLAASIADLQRGVVEPVFDRFVDSVEDLNPRISELTGITSEDLREADGLGTVLGDFWSQLSSWRCARRIAAWGSDCDILMRESDRLGFEIPQDVSTYDLKSTFRLIRSASGMSVRSGCGLESVMEGFNVEFVGQPHDAASDAESTARLLVEVMGRLSIDPA